jgi:uncharacterized protein YcbX
VNFGPEDRVGQVVGLWRYPVKSLAGERRSELTVDERGVVGDRVWALVDGDGKIASGKTTRRFRRVEGLLRHRAYVGPPHEKPMLHLADGRVVQPCDAVAEEVAGPGWTFAREGGISHLDAGAIHVVTTAALASLSAAARASVEVERLRPNVLIDAGDTREEEWLGRRLVVGEAELAIGGRTERCVMVEHQQRSLPTRKDLLHVIKRWNDLYAGVYASVIRPGRIDIHETVYLR